MGVKLSQPPPPTFFWLDANEALRCISAGCLGGVTQSTHHTAFFLGCADMVELEEVVRQTLLLLSPIATLYFYTCTALLPLCSLVASNQQRRCLVCVCVCVCGGGVAHILVATRQPLRTLPNCVVQCTLSLAASPRRLVLGLSYSLPTLLFRLRTSLLCNAGTLAPLEKK